jgi:type IV pilus assembly protein PilB
MINMGIEPFLICSSVIVIVAQRLIRRVCVKCREAYTATPQLVEQFHLKGLMPEHNAQFFRPKGCDKCYSTGYLGRVGITETLVMTSKIKDLVLAGASEMDIKAMARKQGMKTMREDALFKAARGLTTLEEVVRLTAPD